ncbi:amidohydrolase family protein [Nonomuraea sp. NPDC049141]|uniref:amidohydrolase family protein n=1 Tax=Nonomuraea sp. NPDC049141 TaxID=3155500 RepID=UPI0033ECA4B7
MTTATLITNGHVLSMDDAVGELPVGDVLIEDGVIREVAPSIDRPDAEVVDATSMIVMPGFVDTHRHTWQTAVRHYYVDTDPLQYFAEMLGPVGAGYRPEGVYAGNLLGALSALDSGITTLVDWSHIQNTPDHSDAAVQALTESGIRAVFAHGWPLTPEWTRDSALGHPQDIRRLREQYFASDGPECAIQAMVGYFGSYDFTARADSARPGPTLPVPEELLKANWPADLPRPPSARLRHALLAGVPESELTKEHLRALSPVTHVHPGSPPMLLLHGTGDAITSAQQSQWLAEAVQAVGGQARTLLLDGANHEDPAFDEHETIAAVADFFTTHL